MRSGDTFGFMSPNHLRLSWSRAITSSLLLFEALILFSLALYMIGLGFTHDKDWLPFLSTIGFALTGAICLLVLSRGTKDKKRWSSSPAILANLIVLGVAKYQFQAGIYWLSISSSVIALLVIFGSILHFQEFKKD